MINKALHIKICLLLLVGLIWSTSNLFAQNKCVLVLKDAQKLYDEGNIEMIEDTLRHCINSGFSREEKLQAYKLLVLASLYDDNLAKANENMLAFLKLDPEYIINKTVDPAEFINLFNTYNTLPVYSLGVIGGVNKSLINVQEPFGPHNTGDLNNLGSYTSGYKYQVGLKVNRYLFKNSELQLELLMYQRDFLYQNTVFTFADISFSESQTRLEAPLTMTYDFGKRKLLYFLRLGASAGILLNSSADVVRTYNDDSGTPVDGTPIDLSIHRNKMNFWAVGGMGFKYKVPKANIVLDARYYLGLKNQVNPSNRYANSELIYKYFYVDDDFTIDNFAISIGYEYKFYKPKKFNTKEEKLKPGKQKTKNKKEEKAAKPTKEKTKPEKEEKVTKPTKEKTKPKKEEKVAKPTKEKTKPKKEEKVAKPTKEKTKPKKEEKVAKPTKEKTKPKKEEKVAKPTKEKTKPKKEEKVAKPTKEKIKPQKEEKAPKPAKEKTKPKKEEK